MFPRRMRLLAFARLRQFINNPKPSDGIRIITEISLQTKLAKKFFRVFQRFFWILLFVSNNSAVPRCLRLVKKQYHKCIFFIRNFGKRPICEVKKKELKLVDSVVLQSTRLNWTSDNANWCTKTIICHLTNDALIILIGGDVWMNRNYKGREIVYPCESVINVTKLDIAFGKMWQHITHRAE